MNQSSSGTLGMFEWQGQKINKKGTNAQKVVIYLVGPKGTCL